MKKYFPSSRWIVLLAVFAFIYWIGYQLGCYHENRWVSGAYLTAGAIVGFILLWLIGDFLELYDEWRES